MEMMDGRTLAKRLVETTGAPRVLMALSRSGPSYIKSLSYDTRIVDKTVKAALLVLLDMKLVRVVAPPPKPNPFAKEYYDLTSNGREIAQQLVKAELEMVRLFEKLPRQHHPP